MTARSRPTVYRAGRRRAIAGADGLFGSQGAGVQKIGVSPRSGLGATTAALEWAVT